MTRPVPEGKSSDWYVDRLDTIASRSGELEELHQQTTERLYCIEDELNELDDEIMSIIHQMRKEGYA